MHPGQQGEWQQPQGRRWVGCTVFGLQGPVVGGDELAPTGVGQLGDIQRFWDQVRARTEAFRVGLSAGDAVQFFSSSLQDLVAQTLLGDIPVAHHPLIDRNRGTGP